ncbi:hypothetical protein C5Z26_05695 [Lactobacillus sp. CBA3606]|uniref:hypothetical protein n=1 Tax=Lactobacillus sp. CBA3606 TaxID=2099789 RepID=UPI000CFBBA33|nr:hypothetical protein [Lactobacillus sp. CBA3606]AVK63630.1 hypothetical protein C5Z26_05695 [Lactobacillus sp. CBA3606]
MKIEILPATTAVPLAILSMTGLDNRELNPAIEKQLAMRQIQPAQPQNALADLLQLIGQRHCVVMQAWDMAMLPAVTGQLVTTDSAVHLQAADEPPVAVNLTTKSSQVLIVIGDPTASSETVHATGQELQRKLKAFFGIQARLQFRTSSATVQLLDTVKSASSA